MIRGLIQTGRNQVQNIESEIGIDFMYQSEGKKQFVLVRIQKDRLYVAVADKGNGLDEKFDLIIGEKE